MCDSTSPSRLTQLGPHLVPPFTQWALIAPEGARIGAEHPDTAVTQTPRPLLGELSAAPGEAAKQHEEVRTPKHDEGKNQGKKTAHAGLGGVWGGPWEEGGGGGSFLQRQQQVHPHLAGHRYVNDFPPVHHTLGGCYCPLSQGRALQPREVEGRGPVTQAASMSVAGFVLSHTGLCLRVICHSCCLSSHTRLSPTHRARASHSCRDPLAAPGACSSAESGSLRAVGGARSSLTAHPCHRRRHPREQPRSRAGTSLAPGQLL